MTDQQYDVTPGYYPSPWPGEDGGPSRLQAVSGLKGLDIQSGESLKIKASRRLSTGNMVVLRDPGEVYLMHVDTLRDKVGMHCYSHVEKLDPKTLKPIKKSRRLVPQRRLVRNFCPAPVIDGQLPRSKFACVTSINPTRSSIELNPCALAGRFARSNRHGQSQAVRSARRHPLRRDAARRSA